MAIQKQGRTLKGELIGWGKAIVCGIAVAFVLNNCLIVNASVLSGSMETTIMTDDRVLGNRLAYVGKQPERYDVIIFRFPYSEEKLNYVKRVIGLPGEKVEIVDGKVYINDSAEPLMDNFVNGEPTGSYGPFYVPEDNYFLLGDNRNDSYDSKSWEEPFVPKDKILGKMLVTYFPKVKLLEAVADD